MKPDTTSDKIVRRMPSRRWLPALVGVVRLAVTIVLWQAFLTAEQSKIEQLVQNQLINVQNRITSHLNSTAFEFLLTK
jgi:sensor domain CHASE-containing protein